MGDGAMCHYCRKYECECPVAHGFVGKSSDTSSETENVELKRQLAAVSAERDEAVSFKMETHGRLIKSEEYTDSLNIQIAALRAEVDFWKQGSAQSASELQIEREDLGREIAVIRAEIAEKRDECAVYVQFKADSREAKLRAFADAFVVIVGDSERCRFDERTKTWRINDGELDPLFAQAEAALKEQCSGTIHKRITAIESRNRDLVEALESIREKCGPPWTGNDGEDMKDAHDIATEALTNTAKEKPEASDIQQQLDARIAQVEELRAQLPQGMEHCTIRFKECEVGHGRLTATNWIDHGCQQCKIEELQSIRNLTDPNARAR